MTTFDLLRAKRDAVLEMAKNHGVTSIRVFGSVARGEDRAESDVDLLVTTGSKVSAWFPAQLILDLEQMIGRSIDVVTEAGLNPLIREQVLKDALDL